MFDIWWILSVCTSLKISCRLYRDNRSH